MTTESHRTGRKVRDLLLMMGDCFGLGQYCRMNDTSFFLDGVNIGCITLEQAMGSYSRSAPVHRQRNIELIVSHTSAPPSNA